MTTKIVMAGAGALGSQIAWMLACPEIEFTLIDFDRVDQGNIHSKTTVYSQQHIGVFKVNALADLIYRKNGSRAQVYPSRLNADEAAEWLRGDLVVDCFDNAPARLLTQAYAACPVLHVAVSAERSGAILWDKHYTPPTAPAGANPVCTHQLGARILRLTSAWAATVIETYLASGIKGEFIITESGAVLRA